MSVFSLREQAEEARQKKAEAQRLEEEKEAEAERRAEAGRQELALQREQELAGINAPQWGGGFEAKYGEGQAIAVPKGYFERLENREERRLEGEAWAKEQQERREAQTQQEKQERGQRQKQLVLLPAIPDDGPGLTGCDGAEQRAVLLPHTLSFLKWTDVRQLAVLAHEWRIRIGSEEGW
jgi:hypothetical protein